MHMPELLRTYAAKPRGRLRLDADGPGEIQVAGWTEPRAEFTSQSPVGASDDWLEIHDHGSELHATVTGPTGLAVCVPVGWEVMVDGGSGPVRVSGIAGSVRVDNGSGDVDMADIAGSVNVDVGRGRVVLKRIRGPQVRVDCSSGGLQLFGFQGQSCHVDSGSGQVELHGLDVSVLRVDNGSGAATIELDRLHPGGTYHVDTGSGPVRLSVPVGARARLHADVPARRLQLDVQGELLSRGRGEMSLNGGGADDAEIRLDCGGSIHLTSHTPGAVAGAAAAEVAPAAGPDSPAAAAAARPPVAAGTPVGEDEMTRVLKMVEEGKLTPEEAAELLAALEGEPGRGEPT